MKKTFQFALVALLALPLMFACNPKNDPDSPDNPVNQPGTEEWFEKWTEGDKEDKVDIKEESLIGIWQIAAFAYTHEDSVAPLGGNQYINDTYHAYYLEFKQDKSYVYYEYDNGTLLKNEGTWTLDKKKLTFLPSTHNSGFFAPDGEYKIYLLEEERLVLSIPDLHNDEITDYYIYTRVKELPELPLTIDEQLTQNRWKVVSDSVFKYSYEEGVIKVYQEELLQKNSVMVFNADSNVYVLDPNGKIIGSAKWAPRQIFDKDMYLDILTSEGKWPEDREKDLIPGLHNELEFFPMREDGAVFEHMQTLSGEEAPGGGYRFKIWRYHVEAVK